MKVLHDFDGAFKDILDRCRSHLDTLIMLDKLVGVEPIIAIKNDLFDIYPDIDKRIKERYGDLDIRIHVHVIEDFSNEDRRRFYIPPLKQTKRLWRYDSKYVREGIIVLLNDGELPNFHVDYPDYLPHYIEWLYRVKKEGLKIYI